MVKPQCGVPEMKEMRERGEDVEEHGAARLSASTLQAGRVEWNLIPPCVLLNGG